MFYDCNIPYPNTIDATELQRIEKILDRIHSSTVDKNSTIAFNLSLEGNLLDVKKINPISPKKFPYMNQLTRATLLVEDPKKNYQLATSSAYPKIDILAVRPTNADMCKHACQTLEVDLISLDLSKPRVVPGYTPAQVAVNRGIFFEICYSQSFRDPNKKFQFYNNVKRLVEVTRGHHLIFSSEAMRALEVKRPADLRILGSMFGMTHDQIEATVTVNYPRLLKKAGNRLNNIMIKTNMPYRNKKIDLQCSH
ncbi:RNase P subunit p30-domain-containing protein [Gilbertella persicaria]|uniref:RNase P subunit p30-domain-containing protein n=1 Tax=Gilbertella persicaria TaxID=101096 RepID=UPI002220EAE2|nr:RNase P subunit p30-domain-containing protein [Gilbertella persicaria]KAI8049430.1 RNase P subunit p30-domain-containing protein [Gilbertella persicaria]